jgi:excisionase family DNA binding protein
MTPEPALMTVNEVAATFRVMPSTVRAWARSGRLDSVRTPGGQYRFHPDVVTPLRDREANTNG